jgi:hypothetical protein
MANNGGIMLVMKAGNYLIIYIFFWKYRDRNDLCEVRGNPDF